MILGKRLRAPDSSWGGRRCGYILVVILTMLFFILSPLTVRAGNIYLSADKSNWPDELKNAYKGAYVYSSGSTYYDKDKLRITSDEDGSYYTNLDTNASSVTISKQKKSGSWIGTPEYDSSTNIFRIHYYSYVSGYDAYTNICVQPIYNNASTWAARYSYSGGNNLELHSWDQRSTIDRQAVTCKTQFTFNGKKAPMGVDYEGYAYTPSSYTKTYSLANGVWWTIDTSIKNNYTPYQFVHSMNSEMEGYIYIGNIPKGQSVTVDIYPVAVVDYRDTFYSSWGSGSTRFTLSGHTHNSSGIYYSSTGNSSTHTKYTYCTDHGTDHSQNRVGTSEAHVDSNNDGACDKCGQVYRTRGYLDLNGVLNGVTSGNIAGYGTANVYVAGRGTSSNVTDYYYLTAAGTSYTITPKANSGYTYLGVASGNLSGTMPSGNYGVQLKFGSNYTIAFNGNGATSGSTASESRVYSDSAKPLTANGFERTHYLFNGWNTSADGSGTGYSDQQSVSNLTSTVNGTVTLYAQWKDAPGYHDGKAIVYTITYTLYPKNGANITIIDPGNPTTYTVEDEIPLKNPSATNYSFEGWYGSGTNGSKGVTIQKGSMGDLHFEADWLPTKDSNKSSGKDQTIPYVKTTPIIENKVKIAA